MMSTSCAYPTDVSDGQWEVLQRLLPTPKWQPGGPGRKPLDLRLVLHGIFYVNKTGCQWRMMPTDFGNGHTIYGYFRRWRQTGVWGGVMDTLRRLERQRQGRLPEPSACCADSQSIKTATQDEEVGFDGHKKIKGRKRHITPELLKSFASLFRAKLITTLHLAPLSLKFPCVVCIEEGSLTQKVTTLSMIFAANNIAHSLLELVHYS